MFAERRAAEPVLPLSLFRNSVFATTSLVGLIVGFALFGSVTYLPLFLQVVNGASPTASGLQLLPVMGGLLIASIGSGQLITRTGRYKVFPIVGTAVMVVGLYLLSLMNADTSVATASAYMFVLGLGLGLVMQVLVLAVQNAVDYSELGVATSGATLFRSIGGSFGASVLGAIFANQLAHNLARGVPRPAAPRAGRQLQPRRPRAAAAGRPRRLRARVHGLAQHRLPRRRGDRRRRRSRCTWFIKELPLRDTVATAGVGEAFAVPKDTDPLAELARELSILTRREQAGTHPRAARGPCRRRPRARPRPGCSRASTATPSLDLAALAAHLRARPGVPRGGVRDLVAEGLVAEPVETGGTASRPLTPAGTETFDRLTRCGEERLTELLAGWQPEQHPELRSLIEGLAAQFLDTSPAAAAA